jgi:hypothetical protein
MKKTTHLYRFLTLAAAGRAKFTVTTPVPLGPLRELLIDTRSSFQASY